MSNTWLGLMLECWSYAWWKLACFQLFSEGVLGCLLYTGIELTSCVKVWSKLVHFGLLNFVKNTDMLMWIIVAGFTTKATEPDSDRLSRTGFKFAQIGSESEPDSPNSKQTQKMKSLANLVQACVQQLNPCSSGQWLRNCGARRRHSGWAAATRPGACM